MDLHPEEEDFLDQIDYEIPENSTQTTKNDGLIHTPSPPSDGNGQYTGAKIHYSVPEKGKQNGSLEKVPTIRYDFSISLRNPGQKMTDKTPKTCLAQFCIMRSTQAYENKEFYTTAVNRAKEELKKVTPFSTLQQFKGPWMPEIKFTKPSFKYANTDTTCAYFHTYPSYHDIQFMMEPFDFGKENTAPHYKFYIILECEITTKIQLQKIKLENTEQPFKHAQSDSDFNDVIRNLINNADKALSLLNSDVQRANSEWFGTLAQYRDQKAALTTPDCPIIQPQPYRQSLPDDQHTPKQGPAMLDQGIPNLKIQITSGQREVFHTPDTTGTPQPPAIEEAFPINIVHNPMEQNYQQQQHLMPHLQQPQITPTEETLTPRLFFNMMVQQRQQQQQQQPQLQMQQQIQHQPIQVPPQQLPIHQRLGPQTPPVSTTPPPLPPKKRVHHSGNREERRQHLQPEYRQQRESNHRQWKPHWERDSRHSQSDYHSHDEDDERRRRRSRSRSRSREAYHPRDPRRNPPPYRPRGSGYKRFPPRHNKPPRPAQYGDYKQQRREQHTQEGQHQEPKHDPSEFTEYAKILNVPPEKMCEAYQVLHQAMKK